MQQRLPIYKERSARLQSALEINNDLSSRLGAAIKARDDGSGRELALWADLQGGISELQSAACQLDPQNAAYAAELAYQELLLGNVSSASATLKRAATLEQGSNELLQYNVRCLLAQGELDEAEGQARSAPS